MAQPASIRYNNPGAMYPGTSARRFGTTGTEVIGGGHKIAVFPDAESGAAAQFDLLSRLYTGKPFAEAIRTWSGGNASPAYAAEVARKVGIDPSGSLTPEMIRDPRVAIPLARAMADWEAGRPSPLTDAQWSAGHARAFGAPMPQPPDGMDAATYNTNSPASGRSAPTSQSPMIAENTAPRPKGGLMGALFPGIDLPQVSQRQQLASLGAAKAAEAPNISLPPLATPQLPQLDMTALRNIVARRGTLGA